MNKSILIFFFVFSFLSVFSKPNLVTFNIEKNEDKNIFFTKNSTVYFFCPTSHVKKEKYIEQIQSFINSERIDKIENLNIVLVLFIENLYDPSQGVNCYFSADDSLIINEFCVCFQNFEKNKILKTQQRKEIIKYYDLRFLTNSIVNICLKPTKCFNNLSEKIFEYEKFVSELFNPIYSESEKISILEDSIKHLNFQLDNINIKLGQIERRIEIIENKEINTNPIQPSKNDNEEKNFKPIIRIKNKKNKL
jgi:hypothetical protein